jgi:hypothetical protein
MHIVVAFFFSPENDKSFDEKQEEEYLIKRKIDIVNQRAYIVDSMDEDRLRCVFSCHVFFIFPNLYHTVPSLHVHAFCPFYSLLSKTQYWMKKI